MKTIRNVMLIAVILTTTRCNLSEKANSPNEALMNRIQSRYAENNYVQSTTEINPYEETGKNVANIYSRIVKAAPHLRQINSRRKNTNTVFSLASYNQFQMVNNSSSSWGVTDEDTKSDMYKAIKGYYSEKGEDYSEKQFNSTNDILKSYDANEMGALKLLDDALRNKKISQLQYDIIILHYNEIAKAKTKAEANQINNTLESEIIKSDISDKEKQLLLVITSIIRNSVLNNPNLTLLFGDESTSNFRQTSGVLKAVGAVVAGITGAVVGAIAGFVSSLFTCETDYWGCVWKGTAGGAASGFATGIYLFYTES